MTEEQTRLAALQAEKARRKTSSPRSDEPADADAYRTIRLAEADRDAIKARAEALAGGNQALIAADRIVEQLPTLVEAAAKGLSGANIVLVNGTEGVTDLITNLVTQVLIYEAVKGGVPQTSTLGCSTCRRATGRSRPRRQTRTPPRHRCSSGSTDRARRVLVLAQDEARLLNHGYIGTEHILLGLIQEAKASQPRLSTHSGSRSRS